MSFKEFILVEDIKIDVVKPQVLIKDNNGKPILASPEELKAFIVQSLKKYFNRFDQNGFKFALARYDFVLNDVRDGWGEVIFKFSVIPKGRGMPEMLSPDDYRYEFYKGKSTGNKVFKTPKDAIEAIPEDNTLAYRGMAWEEWQAIRKTGYIKSHTLYNLGKAQENLTFFGNAPTATEYANSFASLAYKTSIKKPGVIIAVPRNMLITHEEMPAAIPAGEFAYKGGLPSSYIKSVWILTPTKAKSGNLDLIFLWQRKDTSFQLAGPAEGSRSNPSVSYAVMKLI